MHAATPMRQTLLALSLALLNAASLNAAETARGVTEPFLDAVMNSPVDGIIAVVHCNEGDTVEKGTPLIELDKSLQELEVNRRQIILENLRSELRRTEALFERTKGVSVEELERKRLEAREAEAEHDLARDRLDKRTIRAPFSGTVVDRLGRAPGEGLRQNESPLLRLVDTSKLRFVCRLDEPVGREFKLGQTVNLLLGDNASKTGQVCYVSPVVDPASGLMTIKVLVDNADGSIRPGIAGLLELEP
jgi:RND family efflux transporter MFP subunit